MTVNHEIPNVRHFLKNTDADVIFVRADLIPFSEKYVAMEANQEGFLAFLVSPKSLNPEYPEGWREHGCYRFNRRSTADNIISAEISSGCRGYSVFVTDNLGWNHYIRSYSNRPGVGEHYKFVQDFTYAKYFQQKRTASAHLAKLEKMIREGGFKL